MAKKRCCVLHSLWHWHSLLELQQDRVTDLGKYVVTHTRFAPKPQ